MAYTFPDQIETYYNNLGLFVSDNDTFNFGAWTNQPTTDNYYRTINIVGNSNEIKEYCFSGVGPFNVATSIVVGPTIPAGDFGVTSYIVTPTYTDTADYILSSNPPPSFNSGDFLFSVSSYFLIDRTASVGFSGTAKSITQFQPADSIIIYNIFGSGENIDNDLSQAGNDLVLAVIGANPIVNGISVFSVNVFNNITCTSSTEWDINGEVVDAITPLPTSNDGRFTVDADGNLIYQWQLSGVITPGDPNLAPPFLRRPTIKPKDKVIPSRINRLRRALTLRNKVIL